MITYNNIVSKFEQFVDAHFFVQTFSHGSPGDVDLDKLETYPLLHLVYTGGGYADNTKTYNLEVYILDNPPREGDKVEFQKATITQCEQAAEDILADIQNGGNIFQFGYDYDLLSANITPLEDERSNILAGSLLTLSIGVRYQYDSCNAPLTGVEPEGTPPQPFKARGLLRVREVDGDPDVLSVATINVPDGSLTDDGDGEITLTFAAGPGGDSTRLVQTVKNVSGGELTKGTPVHAVVDGASGNLAYVIAARADTPSAMPATFVLNETLADQAEGEAIITGLLQGVDTDAFAPGDVVYVGATGGYTNVKPTGTNLIQNLGIVLKSHPSNGSGIVYGAGRSNDVPNLPDGKFFIGSATNTQTSAYGLPTSDPSDGQTLVYNATNDAFESGYPTSEGQVSTVTLTSTASGTVPNPSAGNVPVRWGSIGAGTLSVTQELRNGYAISCVQDTSAGTITSLPLQPGSTVSLSYSIECRAPTGTLATTFMNSKTGYWSDFTNIGSVITADGTYHTITIVEEDVRVESVQLANAFIFRVGVLLGGPVDFRNPQVTFTINHV